MNTIDSIALYINATKIKEKQINCVSLYSVSGTSQVMYLNCRGIGIDSVYAFDENQTRYKVKYVLSTYELTLPKTGINEELIKKDLCENILLTAIHKTGIGELKLVFPFQVLKAGIFSLEISYSIHCDKNDVLYFGDELLYSQIPFHPIKTNYGARCLFPCIEFSECIMTFIIETLCDHVGFAPGILKETRDEESTFIFTYTHSDKPIFPNSVGFCVGKFTILRLNEWKHVNLLTREFDDEEIDGESLNSNNNITTLLINERDACEDIMLYSNLCIRICSTNHTKDLFYNLIAKSIYSLNLNRVKEPWILLGLAFYDAFNHLSIKQQSVILHCIYSKSLFKNHTLDHSDTITLLEPNLNTKHIECVLWNLTGFSIMSAYSIKSFLYYLYLEVYYPSFYENNFGNLVKTLKQIDFKKGCNANIFIAVLILALDSEIFKFEPRTSIQYIPGLLEEVREDRDSIYFYWLSKNKTINVEFNLEYESGLYTGKKIIKPFKVVLKNLDLDKTTRNKIQIKFVCVVKYRDNVVEFFERDISFLNQTTISYEINKEKAYVKKGRKRIRQEGEPEDPFVVNKTKDLVKYILPDPKYCLLMNIVLREYPESFYVDIIQEFFIINPNKCERENIMFNSWILKNCNKTKSIKIFIILLELLTREDVYLETKCDIIENLVCMYNLESTKEKDKIESIYIYHMLTSLIRKFEEIHSLTNVENVLLECFFVNLCKLKNLNFEFCKEEGLMCLEVIREYFNLYIDLEHCIVGFAHIYPTLKEVFKDENDEMRDSIGIEYLRTNVVIKTDLSEICLKTLNYLNDDLDLDLKLYEQELYKYIDMIGFQKNKIGIIEMFVKYMENEPNSRFKAEILNAIINTGVKFNISPIINKNKAQFKIIILFLKLLKYNQ